jgi:solute carrier family 35 protein E1
LLTRPRCSPQASMAEQKASTVKLLLLIVGWYVGNTFYNIYNKKACSNIHAHWTVAFAQLVVGVVWSVFTWMTFRKAPKISGGDWMKLAPIGLFAAAAHGGSVLAMGAGAVSFAQIVKACEPVYVALLCLVVPPIEIKPALAYLMLMVIVGGVAMACVKEGKGVEINMEAFGWASFANLAAALKGKLGKEVTHDLKAKKATNNMDSANAYAVMNILSALWTFIVVAGTELSTIKATWDHAIEDGAKACKKDINSKGCVTANDIITNVVLSGFFFYLYNELAFQFTAEVGPVTSSVMNTAKRVIVIVASAIVFAEPMEKNAMIGSAVAITGVLLYSLAEEAGKKAKAKAH